MHLNKLPIFIFLSLLTLLSSCSNTSDEFDMYFNNIYPEIEEETIQTEQVTEEYMELILDSKPKKAINLLNDQVIPHHKILLDKLSNVDLTEADLIEFNKLSQEITQIKLDQRLYSKNLFEDAITAHEQENLEDFNIDNATKGMYTLNEQYINKLSEQVDYAEKLSNNYDTLKFDRINSILVDINTLNNAYDELIEHFSNHIDVFSEKTNNAFDEALLNDQGNPEIVLDGEMTIFEDTFLLEGNSNLLSGAILNVKSYQYGSENPYFTGDFQVDEDGHFELEMESDKKALDNEPFTIEIAYLPETSDDLAAHDIYGKRGEKLTGPFKKKYTEHKQTRFGAFAYAYLNLTPGDKANFQHVPHDKPEDYGDVDVWMDKDNVEIKDNYYDITMKSNLNELVHIDGTVMVDNDELTDFTSNTTVGPDGSFRFRIPKPNVEKTEGSSVAIKIEATSEGAIETEEIYGKFGGDFEGELTKETKRGKKIEYHLNLDN